MKHEMIFPKFEVFLNTLSYLYCTDSIMRDLVDSIPIKFSSLPKAFGVDVANKIQISKDKKVGTHEEKRSIEFLERMVDDFQLVPKDQETLVSMMDDLSYQNTIFVLCDRGRFNPKSVIDDFEKIKTERKNTISYGNLSSVMDVYLRVWRERALAGQAHMKIPGFEMLSDAIGGFNSGRLGILMAQTGFGKTNIGLSLALAARKVFPVAYVNMEMSLEDIARRIAILETKISYRDFLSRVSKETFSFDDGFGFVITEGKSLSLAQIKSWVLGQANKTKLLVIDYDQCVDLETSKETPEWKAMQKMLVDLDDFAKHIECYVLVLAQINRFGEISSSYRATFKAHTVMHFKECETNGFIIHAVKNRHGKKNAAVSVMYDEENSSIKEFSVVTANENTKRVLKPKKESSERRYS